MKPYLKKNIESSRNLILLIFFCILNTQAITQSSPGKYSNNRIANADYLKALSYIIKGVPQRGGSPDTLLVAVHLLQNAIHNDSNFFAAYMELSRAYWFFNFSFPNYETYFGSAAEILPKAKDAVLHALRINNASAEAWAALATMNMNYEYRWDEALSNFSNAIHYDSTNATYFLRCAELFALKGNWDEAERWIERGNKISPKDNQVLLWTGWLYHWKRDYEKANDYFRQLQITGLSRKFYLGLNYLAQGKFKQAVDTLKTLYSDFENADGGSKAALAFALVKNGQKKDGMKLLKRSYQLHQLVDYRAAAVYVARKKYRKAFRLLEKDFALRSNWMVWLKYDPVWDPIRNKPRFQELIHKMGFE